MTNMDLVLIHGWGASPQWMQPLAEAIRDVQANVTCHVLSLPEVDDPSTVWREVEAQWLPALDAQIPPRPCYVLGWSLGGTLALRLGDYLPSWQIQGLLLLNATPKFCQASDWPWGMDERAFDQLTQSCQQDWPQALAQFRRLQVKGDRQQWQQQKRWLAKHPQLPNQRVSLQGLSALKALDNRQWVANLTIPNAWWFNSEDALVSPQTALWLTQQPAVSHVTLKQGGHVSPLSQAKEIAMWVMDSIQGWSSVTTDAVFHDKEEDG